MPQLGCGIHCNKATSLGSFGSSSTNMLIYVGAFGSFYKTRHLVFVAGLLIYIYMHMYITYTCFHHSSIILIATTASIFQINKIMESLWKIWKSFPIWFFHSQYDGKSHNPFMFQSPPTSSATLGSPKKSKQKWRHRRRPSGGRCPGTASPSPGTNRERPEKKRPSLGNIDN